MGTLGRRLRPPLGGGNSVRISLGKAEKPSTIVVGGHNQHDEIRCRIRMAQSKTGFLLPQQPDDGVGGFLSFFSHSNHIDFAAFLPRHKM